MDWPPPPTHHPAQGGSEQTRRFTLPSEARPTVTGQEVAPGQRAGGLTEQSPLRGPRAGIRWGSGTLSTHSLGRVALHRGLRIFRVLLQTPMTWEGPFQVRAPAEGRTFKGRGGSGGGV